jgi:hypothetical protein
MTGWLAFLVGPIVGVVVVRISGRRSPVLVMLGALLGQLLAITLYRGWQTFELAHPPRNRDVAYFVLDRSVQQRVGGWMILAGIALAVAVVALMLQRDRGAPSEPPAQAV